MERSCVSSLLKPCDALSCSEPYCVAFSPKQSKAARRQLRAQRTALKRVGIHVTPPPGLPNEDERVDSSCDLDKVRTEDTTLQLAKRVERLELLLFRCPAPDFVKLDAYIGKIMTDSLDSMHQGEFTSTICPVHNIASEVGECTGDLPASCEVFDISDEAFVGRGLTQEEQVDASMLTSPFAVLPDDSKIVARMEQLDIEMERLMSALESIGSAPLHSPLDVCRQETQIGSSRELAATDEEIDAGQCSKCAGEHATEECPYFKLPRTRHQDAFRNMKNSSLHPEELQFKEDVDLT